MVVGRVSVGLDLVVEYCCCLVGGRLLVGGLYPLPGGVLSTSLCGALLGVASSSFFGAFLEVSRSRFGTYFLLREGLVALMPEPFPCQTSVVTRSWDVLDFLGSSVFSTAGSAPTLGIWCTRTPVGRPVLLPNVSSGTKSSASHPSRTS